jgi:hypothetical protein
MAPRRRRRTSIGMREAATWMLGARRRKKSGEGMNAGGHGGGCELGEM